MSELQATLEFSIELHKFYNVDLFQRGYYQIRCDLNCCSKLSAKTEVSLPRGDSLESTIPASIINGTAVSKTFQILYRNEEIVLKDVIHYRVHVLLDSAKIQETLNSADFELEVGLWFSESGFGMEQMDTLECVSSRNLKLEFVSSQGLHYCVPVLFDYFHLAAVSITVHGVLVSIHQPYLSSPRPGNKRGKGKSSASNFSTMETVLFGQNQLNVKYGTMRTRLAIASAIYQEVCMLLLQSLEGLQISLEHLSHCLPDLAKPQVKLVDVRDRVKKLSKVAEGLDNEDDFLLKANSDISQLCAENILLWNKYLDTFTLRDGVRQHLAEIHHNHRLRRFSEGFFTMRNPRKSVLCCLDAKHQHHLTVSDAVRKSEYFQSLPDLQVHCKAIDGSPGTLPIIFEDTYSDGIPKRNSSCDNIHLYAGCLVVPNYGGDETNLIDEKISSDKPSNFSKLATDPQTSLDQLHHDLSLLVNANKDRRSEKFDEKSRRKKISLPSKLSRTKTSREMGSWEFQEKYAIPRKASLDSVSPVGLGTQAASADSRFNLRDKLRNSIKSGSELNRSFEKPSSSVKSGFSHLECCSEVPYNLEEEPEETEGSFTPPTVHPIPPNPETDKDEESSISERSGYISNTTRTSSDISVSSPEHQKQESPRTPGRRHRNGGIDTEFMELNIREKTRRENKERSGSKMKTKERTKSDDYESIIINKEGEGLRREEDGRRRTIGPGDQNSEKYTMLNPEKERRDCFVRLKSDFGKDKKDEVARKDGVGTSRLRKYLQEEGSGSLGLGSPGLVLGRTERSRSEEVEKEVGDTRRPRHRSECLNEKSVRSPQSPGSHSLKTTSTASYTNKNKAGSSKGSKSTSLPPPMEFRDPPRATNQGREERLLSWDGSSSRIKESKLSDPIILSFVKPENRHTHSTDKHDTCHKLTNENKQLSEGKSRSKHDKSSVKSDRSSRKDDKSRLNQGKNRLQDDGMTQNNKDGMMNDKLYASLTRMSRSNTISYIAEDNVAMDEFRRRKLNVEKPLTDVRRRKQNSSAAKLSSRLSSSLQFIDRHAVDALHISNQNSEGDMLEQKSVRSQQKVFALESSNLGFTCCDWIPNHISLQNPSLLKKIEYVIGGARIKFVSARENFKRMTGFPGALYSDFQFRYSTPYFTQSTEIVHNTSHLVVCVHGLDGNSADLRLVKTYLEIALPSANLDFLMSEINQADTFLSLEDMTDKLVNEINYHIRSFNKTITRISFIGHSLGCILIRSAISRPELSAHSSKFYTFLSLSGPHLGTLYNNSGLVNAGLWMIQKWKKAGSLQQLTMKDSGDIRETFLYKLAQKSNLQLFKHVLLAGSSQDKYVPIHSARIELCKASTKDTSVLGTAYREMVHYILLPIVKAETEIVRYDVHHALPNNTNSLIGRAAHIAVLDSELFIEKFLVIAALKYFQ